LIPALQFFLAGSSAERLIEIPIKETVARFKDYKIGRFRCLSPVVILGTLNAKGGTGIPPSVYRGEWRGNDVVDVSSSNRFIR
jgi:hypothetical protein